MKKSTAYLDGVRGLAAYLVVVQHYGGEFDMMAHEFGFGERGFYFFGSLPFLRTFLSGGNAAVSIFFVLSGYVLSKSPLKLLRKEELPGATRLTLTSAVIRRPIRIFIPCIMIGLLTAIGMHFPGGPYFNGPWEPQETLMGELINWVVKSFEFFNPFKGIDPPFYRYGMVMWTIPLEYWGSMLVFGLLFLDSMVRVEARYVVAAQALAVVICFFTVNWAMACFIAGLALAYVDVCELDNWIDSHLTKLGKAICFNTMFVVAWYLIGQAAGQGGLELAVTIPGWGILASLTPPWYKDNNFFRFWPSVGAIMMVYSILRLEWLQRFFNTRVLQYLGRVSFMLYLIHIIFVWSIGALLRCALGECKHYEDRELEYENMLYIKDIGPQGLSTRAFVGIFILSAVCIPISELLVRILDEPCVRLGKQLTTELGLERKRKAGLEEKDDFAAESLLGERCRRR